MIEKMKAFLKQNDMCVLATSSDNRPHCSLMAYVTDDEAETVYMITRRGTRKHRNLLENPQVSLLVDTRARMPGIERGSVQAMTVSGVFLPSVDHNGKDAFHRRILERHPHLEQLAADPEAVVVAIRVESFLLLDGPTRATFRQVTH